MAGHPAAQHAARTGVDACTSVQPAREFDPGTELDFAVGVQGPQCRTRADLRVGGGHQFTRQPHLGRESQRAAADQGGGPFILSVLGFQVHG